MSGTAVGLDLSPGAAVVLDGTEWTVELAVPQHGHVVLVTATGERMRATFRFLIHHPACRQSTRTAARAASSRGRQSAAAGDLTPHQRELLGLRMAHLLEVETGFRSGNPLRPAPGEPKPCYDPATSTLTQRRQAKVVELAALDPDQARLLGLHKVGYRTLIRWETMPGMAGHRFRTYRRRRPAAGSPTAGRRRRLPGQAHA